MRDVTAKAYPARVDWGRAFAEGRKRPEKPGHFAICEATWHGFPIHVRTNRLRARGHGLEIHAKKGSAGADVAFKNSRPVAAWQGKLVW
jgi:hypothetical protein